MPKTRVERSPAQKLAVACLSIALSSGCTPLVEARLQRGKGSHDAGSHGPKWTIDGGHDAGKHPAAGDDAGGLDSGMEDRDTGMPPELVDAGHETDGRVPTGDGDSDAGDGDAPDAGHDSGMPPPPPQHCIAHDVFAPVSCASLPGSPPSYNASSCGCLSPEDCPTTPHPLSLCARDTTADPVELEVSTGNASLLEGDLSVHFSSYFDSVISRTPKLVLDGALSVTLEYQGWSLWANTARRFAQDCESKLDGQGRCTAPSSATSWLDCYQHCAEQPTMQVWSYDPDAGDKSCRCSELAGVAVGGDGVKARSGRLREQTATVSAGVTTAYPDNGRELAAADRQMTTDLDTCKSSCLATDTASSGPKCLSWVFAAGATPSNGSCYLQDDTQPLRFRYPNLNTSTTGISKAGAYIQEAMSHQVQVDIDHAMGDYASMSAANWDACSDRCTNDSGVCVAWAFSKTQNYCWLKSSIPTATGSNAVISGVLPALTVHVRHTTASGHADVMLRAGVESFFARTFTLVRDHTARRYSLYDDARLVATGTYTDNPLVSEAVVKVARMENGAVVSANAAPAGELALFNSVLDVPRIQALLLAREPVQ